jgi:ubiquinone/menaquinone biosynthesis C-methylase UbiE
MWTGFFDPDRVLSRLELTPDVSDVADLGCGYGTFTIPAARRMRGVVHAFDIEPDMIETTRRKADEARLANVRFHLRDFVSDGLDLPDAGVDYVMLFNILHAEDPSRLLREACRVLVTGGKVGVLHWNHDPTTPRGPSMDIRPRPEDCRAWMTQERFRVATAPLNLPPYPYGMVGHKVA